MLRQFLLGLSIALLAAACSAAQEPPAPIASTRWALKEALQAHKAAVPRLPPPPQTDDEKAAGRTTAGQDAMRRLLDPEVRANWPKDWLDENMPLTKQMRNECSGSRRA